MASKLGETRCQLAERVCPEIRARGMEIYRHPYPLGHGVGCAPDFIKIMK